MNIALVIWQLDTYGGSIRQILELAKYLAKQNHTVDIFTYHVDRQRCFPEFINDVNIITPEPIAKRSILYNPTDPLFKRIKAFLVNENIQNKQVRAIGDILAKEHAKKNYDVINYHDHGVYKLAHRFPSVKNIWMMNDPPSFIDTKEKDASQYAQSPILPILIWYEREIVKYALSSMDQIVVLDDRNKEIVQRHFKRNAIVVKSGLEIPLKLRKYKQKKRGKTLQVLTTNIFFRHRRYEDLVEAANILINKRNQSSLHFDIIGDPAPDMGYYNSIVNLVEKYRLTRYFTFHGKVSEEVLKKIYLKSHVYVFPNHNQTWGLSVFEAMVNSCAVIVSKTAGAHSVLTNGKNSLLVQAKAPSDIANKIEKLLKDDSLRQKLAKAGHAFVLQNISWEKYGQSMLKIFT